MNENNVPIIIDIPTEEAKKLDNQIKLSRKKHIRNPLDIVDNVFLENPIFLTKIENRNISKSIFELREIVWNIYLKDEAKFNIILMEQLYDLLDTPKQILDSILSNKIVNLKGNDLKSELIKTCGEYAGRIYPYIYKISLSNTNSRRSRAGKTFEAIIYKIYSCLGYPFDSQGKVGRKTFADLGIGKKVDSILPSIKAYKKRRNKTIVGTMKTSLRERWQEVAEEIERTNIPEIHLLTVDENISKNKATEMNNHNIIVVTYDWIAESSSLKPMKNIISFEDYFFEEIPSILSFWSSNEY